MTRAQDTSIYNTSTADNATNEATAQKAAADENTGISDYASSVAKLAASNPYTPGGEYQSDQNQVLSDTSNAGTQALGAQLQSQAQRTGQNPAAAVAATEAGAATNTQNLAANQATSDANRINSEAGYNQGVTADTGQIPGMYNTLSSTTGSQANQQESTAAGASANNQSFGDQFGGAFAKGLGSGLATLATGSSGGGGGGGASSGGGASQGGLQAAQQIAADGGPVATESGPAADELLM